MPLKIMILGSSGMAGHVLTLMFRSDPVRYKVIDVSRSDSAIKPSVLLEAGKFDQLKLLIEDTKPDVIVNCIGLLNQSAENHPDQAILINSYLPHFLEAVSVKTNSKVIHISTDCVFSGEKGGYKEDDVKDGKGFYAQSKALGEIINGKDLTLRTSLIGPELRADGIGLFNWFAKQQGSIDGYSEIFWTGVTSVEIAKAVIEVVDHNITGLYHLVNDVKISKFDLLMLFKKTFKGSLVDNIVPAMNVKHDKSLVNTRKDFNYSVSSYPVMVEEMRTWVVQNLHLYPHYGTLVS